MSEVFKEGYFTEECPLWPGRALSVRIEEVLASEETDYQLLEIFRGEGFGKMLALDGKIQLAESDEFIYHEMFVHVPCFSHPEPENVLVIGGGDGGVVRELLKHSCIEHIDLCELDEEVVNQCTRFFPWTGKALNDPRVDLHFLDGSLFVKGHPASYDLEEFSGGLQTGAAAGRDSGFAVGIVSAASGGDGGAVPHFSGAFRIQRILCLFDPELSGGIARVLHRMRRTQGGCAIPASDRGVCPPLEDVFHGGAQGGVCSAAVLDKTV